MMILSNLSELNIWQFRFFSSMVRTFQGKLNSYREWTGKAHRALKSSHRGQNSQDPCSEDEEDGQTQGFSLVPLMQIGSCKWRMLSGGPVRGMAATKVIGRWTCLSGCQDQGIWERMGCLALHKAEPVVSQLLTHPQMVVRSPRDGCRLCAPKKHQGAMEGPRWLHRSENPFITLPQGPEVPALRGTLLQGDLKESWGAALTGWIPSLLPLQSHILCGDLWGRQAELCSCSWSKFVTTLQEEDKLWLGQTWMFPAIYSMLLFLKVFLAIFLSL